MINIEIKTSEKLNSNKSAFVSFHYSPLIVETIKTLPFRHYNPDNKTWEIPLDYIKELQNKLPTYQFKVTGEIDKNKRINIPETYKFKTKPYEYQLDAVKYGLEHDFWFLGDSMGLGKSKETIDIACIRKQLYGYKHCLVVCGVNTLKWNWVKEIRTHSNESAWILGQKRNRNGKVVIGSTKDKINDLKWLLDNETSTYFLITNVESFRDKEFAELVNKLCKNNVINMCIADEAHKMKNPTSQQTKGFLKCNPECKIIMTGTPLMNNPLDLFVILKWLGYEQHPFYAFKQYYCMMGGYGGYEIVGYKHMDELTAQLQSIMLRRLKDDVLDLPEKTYVDEVIEMTDAQNKIYAMVEMDIKSEMSDIVQDVNPLSRLIRLRQATGYTGILSDTVKESCKLDRLEELVDECFSNKEKVLVFSNWTSITNAVYERIAKGKYGVSVITGETKDEDRQNIVDLFQYTTDYNVLIGTIGAMGTGLTCTAATTVIFMDEPWSKALYDQAVDRTHRVGQTNKVTIYNLICKDTIDERIHNLVYEKGAMSDAIVDGKIMGDKTQIVRYLLS